MVGDPPSAEFGPTSATTSPLRDPLDWSSGGDRVHPGARPPRSSSSPRCAVDDRRRIAARGRPADHVLDQGDLRDDQRRQEELEGAPSGDIWVPAIAIIAVLVARERDQDGRGGPPALELRGLTKRYDDGTLALDALDLEVPAGSFFGLLGPNGAGKTTLISAVCNLMRLTGGEIASSATRRLPWRRGA